MNNSRLSSRGKLAEFIDHPVCQRRGARLYLSSFIHSGGCPARVRRCWSGGIRSLPWVAALNSVVIRSVFGHAPALTSKNEPCEADSSRGWNLSLGTSHCPAVKLSAVFARSTLSPASSLLFLVLCTLETFVTLFSRVPPGPSVSRRGECLLHAGECLLHSRDSLCKVGCCRCENPSARVVSSIEHHRSSVVADLILGLCRADALCRAQARVHRHQRRC